MIVCTRCQTQNRDAAHFCRECGQFLDAICPNCTHELPVNAHFCDICGLHLANQSSLTGWIATGISQLSAELRRRPIGGRLIPKTAEPPSTTAETFRSSPLRRFLPRELEAKLEAARADGEMAGERRVVSMLFCDIKGSISVKGKAEPVNAYRVVQRIAQPGRRRGITGLDTRLIGREYELAQIVACADRLLAGVGSLVCLIGEAGLGKSRLIHELQQIWLDPAIGNEDIQGERPKAWHEAASLSYETVQPYALFQRLIRRMAGINEGEAAASATKKVELLIAQLPEAEQEQMVAVFTSMLGLSTALEEESFKRELFDCVPAFFRHRFATTPTVLILDDIHWSDSASIDLLRHLLPLTSELPLLLICILRPDQESPGWQVKLAAEGVFSQQSTVMQLHPLSHSDSNALIDDLLTISDLPHSLRAQILEKSTGNPFFVEEVVRTLIDRGFIHQDESGDRWIATRDDAIELPDNIQSLLTARIDRLAEEVRRTLQLAAVIGRSFYQRVLEHVAEVDFDASDGGDQIIKNHLSILQQRMMILEMARIPEQVYMFRHALTQEATYNGILLRQRRAYHLRTGNILEELYATELEENASTLAHHYWEAGDDERAFRFLVLAGSQAFRLYALQEAIINYDRAMEVVRRRTNVNREQRIELCRDRGRTLELRSQHEMALAHYQEMQLLAEECDDGPLALISMTAQATLYNIPSAVNDPVKGEKMARAAQQLARDIGDWETAAKLLWTLMLGATWVSDDLEKAIEYGEASLRLAREHDLERQLAYTLIDLGTVYMSAGRSDDARAVLEEAQTRFDVLDDRPMMSQARRMSGTHYYAQGQLKQAEQKFEQALEIDRHIWQQARTESEAMGERRMRWQILSGLAEVAEDAQETAELRQSARDIVAYIADKAGRPEHRHSFLNRPDVRSLAID